VTGQEWAILSGGKIVNVVTTNGGRAAAERVAAAMTIENLTVAPLDSLPRAVVQGYRYWNERPL
jgi:hypothetical protein